MIRCLLYTGRVLPIHTSIAREEILLFLKKPIILVHKPSKESKTQNQVIETEQEQSPSNSKESVVENTNDIPDIDAQSGIQTEPPISQQGLEDSNKDDESNPELIDDNNSHDSADNAIIDSESKEKNCLSEQTVGFTPSCSAKQGLSSSPPHVDISFTSRGKSSISIDRLHPLLSPLHMHCLKRFL